MCEGRNATNNFRYIPVLVETATALLGQMLGPNVAQSTWSERGLDVANGTDDHDRRCFQDGNSLYDLLLVDLCEK